MKLKALRATLHVLHRTGAKLGKALCALLLFSSLCAASEAQTSTSALPLPSASLLQQGGLVIYLRHAKTDHQQVDVSPIDLGDCETQRNLSAEGRAQAALIGQAIQRLKLPFKQVHTSPFCRTVETAQIAFGQAANITVDSSLFFSMGLGKDERKQNADYLRAILHRQVAQGDILWLVAHTSNLLEATGIWPKPEGVAWVFRPSAKGYETVGKIEPEQWPQIQ